MLRQISEKGPLSEGCWVIRFLGLFRPVVEARGPGVLFGTVLVVFWGFIVMPHFAAASPKINLYAVIVGVTQFQDPKIPPLTLSAKDAEDFYSFLKERESLFGKLEPELLINEKATRANITKVLRNKLRSAGKDDIVIIYLSGHGAIDAGMSNEFYFITHDARTDNLFGTALLMNDSNLFKGITSDRCLLITDACHSGGFNLGLDAGKPKSVNPLSSMFEGMQGRIGISSSGPGELSYEKPIYGNSVFTHFLLKGLRGEAAKNAGDGVIKAKLLYEFVAQSTREATEGSQNPQMFVSVKSDAEAPVFVAPAYAAPLRLKVQFQYEDEENRIRSLEDGSVLKSGQHVGVTFRAESDCYVYILWWDSNGNVGQLYPNLQLSGGTGEVVAGRTYWLPSLDGERWYVLDDHPGEETIYCIASRTRNAKLEKLYESLRAVSQGKATLGKEIPKAEEALSREISLMGFADRTVPKITAANFSAEDRKSLFESMDNEIRVAGADSVYRVRFRHVER